MPIYEYECGNCGNFLEIHQGYQDKPKKRCPACKRHKLFRVISAPHLSIIKGEGEINVGHLGNRNRDKYGKDQKGDLQRKHFTTKQLKQKEREKNKQENPFETKSDETVRKMSDKQKEDYIKNG